MAWIGRQEEVISHLRRQGAATTPQGFVLSGEPVVHLEGGELAVPDKTVFYRKGRRVSLATSLHRASRVSNPPRGVHQSEMVVHLTAARAYLALAAEFAGVATRDEQMGLLGMATCELKMAQKEAFYAYMDNDSALDIATGRISRLDAEVSEFRRAVA
jgi:hypothetical protein